MKNKLMALITAELKNERTEKFRFPKSALVLLIALSLLSSLIPLPSSVVYRLSSLVPPAFAAIPEMINVQEALR